MTTIQQLQHQLTHHLGGLVLALFLVGGAGSLIGCSTATSSTPTPENTPVPERTPNSGGMAMDATQTPPQLLFAGNRASAQGNSEKALEYYLRATELDPSYAQASLKQGYMYHYLGERALSREAFERAVVIDPDLYYDTMLEPPWTAYDAWIENYPDDPEPYFWRAWEYETETLYEEALEDVNRAIELDPQFIDAYYLRAFLHSSLHKKAAGVTDFSKVIELHPNDVQAYFYRGWFYQDLGEREMARADFAKVLELSDHPEIREQAEDGLRGNVVFSIPSREPLIAYPDINDDW